MHRWQLVDRSVGGGGALLGRRWPYLLGVVTSFVVSSSVVRPSVHPSWPCRPPPPWLPPPPPLVVGRESYHRRRRAAHVVARHGSNSMSRRCRSEQPRSRVRRPICHTPDQPPSHNRVSAAHWNVAKWIDHVFLIHSNHPLYFVRNTYTGT